MGLQEQISDFVYERFNQYRLSGVHETAIADAQKAKTLDNWINQERAIGAVAGAAEMAIPGLGGVTMIAGITYLLHKMARLSWGIGTLKGAVPVEREDISDLNNVLAVWSNDSRYGSHLVAFKAISLNLLNEYMNSDSLQDQVDEFLDEYEETNTTELNDALDKAEQNERIIRNSIPLLPLMASQLVRDDTSSKLLQVIGLSAAGSMLTRSAQRYAGKKAAQKAIQRSLSKRVAQKTLSKGITRKVATKVGIRFAAKVPGRFAMSWIPIAGAVINGALSVSSLNSMRDASIAYYSEQLTRDDLESVL